MFKNIFITLVIFTLALNANNEDLDLKSPVSTDICEKVYDDCSNKCESSKESDIPECFAKCELLYEECIQKNEMESKAK